MNVRRPEPGRITRKQFIRKAGVGAAVVGATAAGLGGVARAHGGTSLPHGEHVTRPDGTPAVAGDPVMWVYPHQYPDDVEHVQWAVDNVASNGTVVLKATSSPNMGTPVNKAFEFGMPVPQSVNSVYIDGKDVTILGEALSRDPGGWATSGSTIHNGNCVFIAGLDAQANVIIRDLIFKEFGVEAVTILGANRYCEVSRCNFIDYFESLTPIGEGMYGAFPIVAAAIGGHTPDYLTGELKVLSNHFGSANLGHTPFDFVNSIAFHVAWCRLDTTVDRNTVDDVYWVGLLSYFNEGRTVITNNTVNKSKTMLLGGAGISVGIGPLPPYPTGYQGSAIISGNTVTMNSVAYSPWNPGDSAISVAAYSEVAGNTPPGTTYEISNNTVNMGGYCQSALTCSGAATNTFWSGNVVNGSALYGILVKPGTFRIPIIPGWEWVFYAFYNLETMGFPTNNTFSGNDLKNFKAYTAQAGVEKATLARINGMGGLEFFEQVPTYTTLKNDDYGELFANGVAGAYIDGFNHSLTNENFWGVYPGMTVNPPQPCVLMEYGSGKNTITALKNGQVISGIAKCNQILDMNLQTDGTTTNVIPGLESCTKVDVNKLAALKAAIEARHQAPPVPPVTVVDVSKVPASWKK